MLHSILSHLIARCLLHQARVRRVAFHWLTCETGKHTTSAMNIHISSAFNHTQLCTEPDSLTGSDRQHDDVGLCPAYPRYCRTGLGARQGAALPHETGGHDVEDVSGFSRLFWPSTVPAPRVIGLHSRAEIPTSRSAVGGGVGDGASAQTAHMSSAIQQLSWERQ